MGSILFALRSRYVPVRILGWHSVIQMNVSRVAAAASVGRIANPTLCGQLDRRIARCFVRDAVVLNTDEDARLGCGECARQCVYSTS